MVKATDIVGSAGGVDCCGTLFYDVLCSDAILSWRCCSYCLCCWWLLWLSVEHSCSGGSPHAVCAAAAAADPALAVSAAAVAVVILVLVLVVVLVLILILILNILIVVAVVVVVAAAAVDHSSSFC